MTLYLLYIIAFPCHCSQSASTDIQRCYKIPKKGLNTDRIGKALGNSRSNAASIENERHSQTKKKSSAQFKCGSLKVDK